MNSLQIQYFLSSAHHLNFTKAAEECHSSQPTVSRQIAFLEEELGFKLFHRDKGTLKLTAGGAIMAQEFRRLRKSMDESIRLAKESSKKSKGQLSIGYLSNFNTDMFVHPPLIKFSKDYPDVEITLGSSTFSGLRKKLLKGVYDIIFTYNFEIRELEDIIYRKCYRVTPMIVMSNNHPLAKKKDLKHSDFNGHTFILPDPQESPGRIDELRSIFKALGIDDIHIEHTQNIESLFFKVRTNSGLAFISTAMDCIFDNRYYCYILPKAGIPPFVAAVWESDNLNPFIPLFVEILTNVRSIDVYKKEYKKTHGV